MPPATPRASAVSPDQPGEGRLAHASADHPPVPRKKVGVVLANLGTPDATDYWSMRRYLSEFLSDQRVVDYSRWLWQPLLQGIILTRRPFISGKAYQSIWNTERNESPLLTITREQAEKVAERLDAAFGDQVVVDFCMRYGNPSTSSVIHKLHEQGCERLLFFPLYPQYGSPTTATANDEVFRTLMTLKWQPALRTVPAYFDRPDYIAVLGGSIQAAYERAEADQGGRPEVLVASYHGVPERYLLDGDPYHCQCHKTTRLVKEHLDMADDEIVTAFQSKFGPEKWVGPATVDKVEELARAGKKHIAVISPAFASDCVETLEEVQQEIREAFLAAGGETFTYVPCLNADEAHIDVLTAITRQELGGWL